MGRSSAVAGDGVELGLVDLVVAAQKRDDRAEGYPDSSMTPLSWGTRTGWLPMKATHLMSCEALDAEEGGDVRDGAFAGGVDELGEAVAGGCEVVDGREGAGGFLEVGGVAGGELAIRSSPASV